MMREWREEWEQAGISNDFFFGKVMQNPELCKQMLERILNVKIERIEYLEPQKTLKIAPGSKGIRLDVYVQDEAHTVYDVEIQTGGSRSLGRRARYYQAIIDLYMIEKGAKYDSLKKSFVIFICTFDLFGQGRHIYTFENLCREDPSLALDDGAVKVFLNAQGTRDDVSPELKAFLHYLAGQKSDDPFVQELDEEVERIRSNEKWRRDFMKWYLDLMDSHEDGVQEGIEKGIGIGVAKVVVPVLLDQQSVVKTAKLLHCSVEEVSAIAREKGIVVSDMVQ